MHSSPPRRVPSHLVARLFAPLVATAGLWLVACHPFEDAEDYPYPQDQEDLADDVGDGVSTDTDLQPDADTADDFPFDTVGPACAGDSDCPAQACETWACVDGTCALQCIDCDLDGYGQGPACDGPDCLDSDPAWFEGKTKPCAAADLGTCNGGVIVCTAQGETGCLGALGPAVEICNDRDDDCDGAVDDELSGLTCLGQCAANATGCVAGLSPSCGAGAPETCNDKDDDCDGMVDELCGDGCIWVSADAAEPGDGSAANPFPTIEQALNVAAPGHAVCLMARPGCDPTDYVYVDGSTLEVPAGVRILGSFDRESLLACPNLATVLRVDAPQGVVFGPTSHGASLARVTIERRPGAGDGLETIAIGVTVSGAQDVVLSDLAIIDEPSADLTVGVLVVEGASMTLSDSHIVGGNGTSAVGVMVEEASVRIVDNCPGGNGAACVASCAGAAQGIRGGGSGELSIGVLLQTATDSVVERNLFCPSRAEVSAGIAVHDTSAALAGSGGSLTVAHNAIDVVNDQGASAGISIEGCGGASPLLLGNRIRFGAVGELSGGVGIGVSGDCAPTLADNAVQGAEVAAAAAAIGVSCTQTGDVRTRCTLLDNAMIAAGGGAGVVYAVGIECVGGACERVVDNRVGPGRGTQVAGIALTGGSAYVARNVVEPGCGGSATGLYANDVLAFVHSNLLMGLSCDGEAVGGGVVIEPGPWMQQTYLHSNTVVGSTATSCTSSGGVFIGPGGLGSARRSGLLRNNIVHAGTCGQRAAVAQMADNALRVVDHNDLYGNGGAVFARGLSAALTLAETPFAADNLSIEPGFVSFPTELHLAPGSGCIDQGTEVDLPTLDLDGDPRGSAVTGNKPDLGADERSP